MMFMFFFDYYHDGNGGDDGNCNVGYDDEFIT